MLILFSKNLVKLENAWLIEVRDVHLFWGGGSISLHRGQTKYCWHKGVSPHHISIQSKVYLLFFICTFLPFKYICLILSKSDHIGELIITFLLNLTNVVSPLLIRLWRCAPYVSCNTLGVWLPQKCISFHKHVHHLSHHAIVTETYICNIRNSVCFILDLLVNGSSATCECNMSFSYLETWQHGRNVAS